MSETFWTRGKLAKRAGVKVATVRYYERRGLLTDAYRAAGGYHFYGSEALQRLHFIRRAQELGFSLKEVAELLEFREVPEVSCGAEVRERAEAKIRDIREKVSDLRRMEKSLESLLETCRGDEPANECPILEALDLHAATVEVVFHPAQTGPEAPAETNHKTGFRPGTEAK